MIPKKTKTEDLDAQINNDIAKAQEEQKKKIGRNRPKLAQAVTSKYFKIFTVLITFLFIGYKMFFASTPNELRKKKITKNRVVKKNNNKETEQQRFADKSIHKSSSGGIYKEKPDSKSVVSFDSQTISNSESLGNVSVPKLNIPSVPTLPTIDKISLKEEQNIVKEEKQEKQEIQEKQSEKKEKVVINSDKNAPIVKKIKKKIRDSSGNIKIIEVDVEVDQNGNIVRESENINKSEKSKSIFGDKQGGQVKKEHPINNELGINALDEMFVLNGKGFSGQQRNSKVSSNNRKDFIVFDSAGINEKEVLTEKQDTNVNKISNPENTIIAGKIMEATLETAIVSETEGTAMAVMSRDVYGESGRKILIPKGSKLYGIYTTTAVPTQTRLLLIWTKIVRPDNMVITINADTYDQSGKKGIEGDINTRYGELFKNSLLYSFVTLGTAVAIEKIAGIKGQTSIVAGNGTSVTNTSPANAAATSVIETAQDIAEKMTKGLTSDLHPIISIPQGMLLKVISNIDLEIPEEYKSQHKQQG